MDEKNELGLPSVRVLLRVERPMRPLQHARRIPVELRQRPSLSVLVTPRKRVGADLVLEEHPCSLGGQLDNRIGRETALLDAARPEIELLPGQFRRVRRNPYERSLCRAVSL